MTDSSASKFPTKPKEKGKAKPEAEAEAERWSRAKCALLYRTTLSGVSTASLFQVTPLWKAIRDVGEMVACKHAIRAGVERQDLCSGLMSEHPN